MRISVVIPTHNRPHRLAKCLESLLPTLGNLDEVIVCFDGCTGDVPQGVEKTHTNKHAGAVAAWNTGYRAALGKYLVLGADDLVFCDPTWIEEALSLMSEQHGYVGLNDSNRGGDDFATHYMVSRNWIDEHNGGLLCTPHYRHQYFDVEQASRARKSGQYVFASRAIVKHEHPAFGKREADTTDLVRDSWQQSDRCIYELRAGLGFPIDWQCK